MEAALATGLAPGTPVAIGAGDLPACVLGAGAAEPGIACSVVGTTCLNGVVSDAPVFSPRDMGILFTIPGDLWIKTMVNVAGTTNLDWSLSALCPDLLGGPMPIEQLASLAGGQPGRCRGSVLCAVSQPYRHHRAAARGRRARRLFGLNPGHGRGDLIRAVYEGLAYAIRDCYDRIEQPILAIRLVGGAARSPFWTQMIADVTGVPVEVPEEGESAPRARRCWPRSRSAGTATSGKPAARPSACRGDMIPILPCAPPTRRGIDAIRSLARRCWIVLRRFIGDKASDPDLWTVLC